MVTLARILPRISMEWIERSNTQNGVNEMPSNEGAVAPGRCSHDQKVLPASYPATADGSTRHVQRVPGSRNRITARSTCCCKLATWNVNTMYKTGRLENLKKEAKRMKLDVVGGSEVRWTGSGNLNSGGWSFYYSGGVRHKAGVGLLLRKKLADAVGCWHVSERVIIVKITAKPIGLNIIEVYVPTGDHGDDEVDLFYEQLGNVRS